MAPKRRQGGDSYFALGRQPDEDTLIIDVTDMWRVRRQFTDFSIEPDTEFLQSEAIRGGIDHVKGQPGRASGGGGLETELYLRYMTPYVQAILNADPKTQSVDIAETVVFDGQATPAGDADGVTELTTGITGEGKDLVIQQPTTPGRLLITYAGGEGEIKVEGRRKTGLSSYDMEPVSETKTFDADGSVLLDFSYHRVDRTHSTKHWADRWDSSGFRYSHQARSEVHDVYTPQRGVFPGWTLYQVIGGIPGLGLSLVPRTMSFDFTNMRLQMDTLARAIWEERTVEGGAFMQKLVDDSDLAGDEFIPNTFFRRLRGVFPNQ